MRRLRLTLVVLASLVMVSTGSSGEAANTGMISTESIAANPSTTTAAPDIIVGRVLDSDGKPIKGSAVVALEDPATGTIVNETAPDAQGNFTFAQVASGDYALVIAAETTHQVPYTPLVLLSSGSTFGSGKTISPGVNVGTILLTRANRAASARIITNADASITVTLAANIFYSGHSFEYPWPGSAPTYDTSFGSGCAAGVACTSNVIKLPSVPARVAVFNGDATRYASTSSGAVLDIFASAYTHNGAKPTCTYPTLGPNRVNVEQAKHSEVAPFNFVGC